MNVMPLTNPRTGRILNAKAALILRHMAGASAYKSTQEQSWPILGMDFGPNAAVNKALDTLEAAGLIEWEEGSTMDRRWAYSRHHRITDAGREMLAVEVARIAQRTVERDAERRAEWERIDAERQRERAEVERRRRIVAAFPDLLNALLHLSVEYVDQEYRIKLATEALAKVEGIE